MWRKVLAPAILVSILWIAGSSITNYFMHRVYESHARALAENVATIRAGWAMTDALGGSAAVAVGAARAGLPGSGGGAGQILKTALV